MRYKFSLFFILLFSIIPILTSEIFNYGLIQSIDFIPTIKNYILNNKYEMKNEIFKIEDSNLLLFGTIYYAIISIIFLVLSFSVRLYESEDQNTKMKSICGFFILTLSIFSIFSSFLNFTEYKKINNYTKLIQKIEIIEIKTNNKLTLDINSLLKIKNIEDFYIKNTVLTIEMTYNKVNIKKLDIKKISNYKKIIKNRYKYKLDFKSEKKITIKKTDAIVLEYELSGSYNLDYIIGVDKEIFVINFVLEDESPENIGMVNDFFINSFNIQRG